MTVGSRSLADLSAYCAGRAVLLSLSCLPRRVGQSIGRALGLILYHLSARHRRVALQNLGTALAGTRPQADHARIARAAFMHLGMICADAAYFPRLLRQPTEALATYEGREHLQQAAADGRGVLVFSGHFGHWELIALLQHRLGVPFAMVARPLENARFDRLLNHLRGLSGNIILPKRNAARGVLRALRQGRAVALLIDQNVRGDSGIFVDFFGVPASTTPSLATFAFKSGAPIVPVFSYPRPDGRLHIRYLAPIRPIRQRSLMNDIHNLTSLCTGILEAEVRRHPELWLWMHQRWRTRPPQTPQSSAADVRLPRVAPDSVPVGEDKVRCL